MNYFCIANSTNHEKHILLVDDDKDELFIFVEALSMTGIAHKCTWAKNGEQAFSQL